MGKTWEDGSRCSLAIGAGPQIVFGTTSFGEKLQKPRPQIRSLPSIADLAKIDCHWLIETRLTGDFVHDFRHYQVCVDQTQVPLPILDSRSSTHAFVLVAPDMYVDHMVELYKFWNMCKTGKEQQPLRSLSDRQRHCYFRNMMKRS